MLRLSRRLKVKDKRSEASLNQTDGAGGADTVRYATLKVSDNFLFDGRYLR